MSIHDLIAEFEAEVASLFSSFRARVAQHSSPAAAVAEPAPAAPAPAAPLPPAEAKPATGSDNPMLDAYKQSNPQHADTGSGTTAPTVDTSADTLDYNVVRDVGINLTGPKTIVNCPVSVVVKVNQASGQSGAHNSYTVTVNGQSSFQANVQAEWISSNVGMVINGPTVTVSVDSPGLQMEIE